MSITVRPDLQGLPYADLVARRDALGEGEGVERLEFVRAIRAQYPDLARAAGRARSAHAHVRYGRNLASWVRRQHGLGTAQLTEDATGAHGDVRARYARELLRLDTVEERQAAWADAHRFLNATADAGRPSDALRSGVNQVLRDRARTAA